MGESDRWQEYGSIGFRIKAFPDNEFTLIFPEWFTSSNATFDVVRPVWSTSRTSAEATVNTKLYHFSLHIRFYEKPDELSLRWNYVFHK